MSATPVAVRYQCPRPGCPNAIDVLITIGGPPHCGAHRTPARMVAVAHAPDEQMCENGGATGGPGTALEAQPGTVAGTHLVQGRLNRHDGH